MSNSDNLLSISILGRARADIPLELFKAIRERGGEVEDCRIAPIGDLLTANMVVSGNWSTLGRLETALPGVAERLELQIRFERCGAREPLPDFRPYAVDVIAPSSPTCWCTCSSSSAPRAYRARKYRRKNMRPPTPVRACVAYKWCATFRSASIRRRCANRSWICAMT